MSLTFLICKKGIMIWQSLSDCVIQVSVWQTEATLHVTSRKSLNASATVGELRTWRPRKAPSPMSVNGTEINNFEELSPKPWQISTFLRKLLQMVSACSCDARSSQEARMEAALNLASSQVQLSLKNNGFVSRFLFLRQDFSFQTLG